MGVTFSGLDERRIVDGWPARVEADDVHMSHATARAFLRLMGVPGRQDGDLCGQVEIRRLRAMLFGARARLARSPAAYTVAGHVVHGPPRTADDGTVVLRPIRLVDFGVDEERLVARIDAMEQLVSALLVGGATHVSWA